MAGGLFMKNYNHDLEKERYWLVFNNLAINWLSLYTAAFWVIVLCAKVFVGFFFPSRERFFFDGSEFAFLFFLIYFVIFGLLLLATLANLANSQRLQKAKLLWLYKTTRKMQRRTNKLGADFFWSEKNKIKFLSRVRARRKELEKHVYYLYQKSGG